MRYRLGRLLLRPSSQSLFFFKFFIHSAIKLNAAILHTRSVSINTCDSSLPRKKTFFFITHHNITIKTSEIAQWLQLLSKELKERPTAEYAKKLLNYAF